MIQASLATTGGDTYTVSLMQHGRESTEQDIAWLNGLIAAERSSADRRTEPKRGASKRRTSSRSLRRKERAT
jgi:hypothetical protein